MILQVTLTDEGRSKIVIAKKYRNAMVMARDCCKALSAQTDGEIEGAAVDVATGLSKLLAEFPEPVKKEAAWVE